ncbi:alpha/beta hydrolase [Aliikangiella sp. IMCC44359]|uniref:alpha/beta hydrolase n=1 Tax=Aliikangiella sp. IMCC44359 TaxID=3459125 RepID=UPI00403AF86E
MFRNIFILILCYLPLNIYSLPFNGLSENIEIKSNRLGYSINYRVFLPHDYADLEELPVIYITDGPSYIFYGQMTKVISKLIQSKKIVPIIAVFIDTREPGNLENNRRNSEFFCNTKYSDFYVHELVPTIDKQYRTKPSANKRVILGLSFGGLNSACFGLLAHSTFGGIGMLSPAMHLVPKILHAYKHIERLPLNFFLSTGTIGDNEDKTRRFHRILRTKGYPIKYKEIRNGRHNWKNWRRVLDDLLIYFFPSS